MNEIMTALKDKRSPKTIKMAFPFYQYSITPNNLVYIRLSIQYGFKHFSSINSDTLPGSNK